MYGVIAEDPSDVEMLQVLLRRLANNSTLPIKGKGFDGCGEMLRKGASQLRLFAQLGCKHFIICYDADGPDASSRKQEIRQKIITPSGQSPRSCLPLIPVQEIEAWILADLHQAISRLIPSWKPSPIANPERIASPKEHLMSLSRGSNQKPRYAPAVHNAQVARYLDLQTVRTKCPSFRPLWNFVVGSRPIQLPAQSFSSSGTRSLWVYTDSGSSSQYVRQLATAHEWGEVIKHVQAAGSRMQELTRLGEYGWADLVALEAELQAALQSKPKARVRAILTTLHQIASNRRGARHIGLDDGTR